MTGVEILTSAEIVSAAVFNWTAFWITFGVVFAMIELVAIGMWLSGDSDVSVIPSFAIFSVVLGVTLGGLSGKICETPTAYETQYKVTISDEVSMSDFYEHYEVIEQDGKIFTVREKTND